MGNWFTVSPGIPSPMLFNLIMDKFIKKVKQMKGYRMSRNVLNILYYADDFILIAENENHLQRFVFNKQC